MCLGAIYWARPSKVFFATTKSDAADAGFDGQFIYTELTVAPESRKIPMFYLRDERASGMYLKNEKKSAQN